MSKQRFVRVFVFGIRIIYHGIIAEEIIYTTLILRKGQINEHRS